MVQSLTSYIQRFLSMGALLSPYILVFNLIFIGFLNYQPMKSLMFIIVLVVLGLLPTIIIQSVIKKQFKGSNNPLCNIAKETQSLSTDFNNLTILEKLNIGYDNPSLIMVVNLFTFSYLFMSMMMYSQYNIAYILFYVLYIVYTFITLGYIGCNHWISLTFGSFLGILFGILGFFLAYSIDKKNTFLNERSSNNVQCYEPSKKKFKCSVYKNGVLVKNL